MHGFGRPSTRYTGCAKGLGHATQETGRGMKTGGPLYQQQSQIRTAMPLTRGAGRVVGTRNETKIPNCGLPFIQNTQRRDTEEKGA